MIAIPSRAPEDVKIDLQINDKLIEKEKKIFEIQKIDQEVQELKIKQYEWRQKQAVQRAENIGKQSIVKPQIIPHGNIQN